MSDKAKEQICEMLINDSDNWGWEGHQSVVSDLLDAKDNITAEELVTFLESAAKLQGGNKEFLAAVEKMKSFL